MLIDLQSDWQRMALYAVGAAIVLFLVFRIPRVGPFIRGAFNLAMVAAFIFVLLRQAPFDPTLSRITERLGLSSQAVVGDTLRIGMSSDGHFWATARVNGVPRRMLIDSGATVTAISQETARLAGIKPEAGGLPVVMRTANGVVTAQTGSVERLTLEDMRSREGAAAGVEARNLKVVTAPGLGPIDVLGMNFLSSLASWRVEGQTLILTPKPAEGAAPG
jgi:aspartyl protease family protein